MQERLQKFIASSSSYSRRKAEELIAAGKVMVNEKVVTELGMKVDPVIDVVRVNGKTLRPVQAFRYVLLHKPAGYVCSRAQHKNEKTVYDLVPDSRELVIAGRLDKDSEGLVLLTNDGTLVNEMTHPKFQHTKEYVAWTKKPITDWDVEKLLAGIPLDEGIAKADRAERIGANAVCIILHQGWNRQIRRMFAALGNPAIRLRRTALGKCTIGNLGVGKYQEVAKNDIL